MWVTGKTAIEKHFYFGRFVPRPHIRGVMSRTEVDAKGKPGEWATRNQVYRVK